jgi:hypothetical protein
MLRLFLLLLLSFTASISLSQAQESKESSSSAPQGNGTDALAIALLEEAHDLGPQLPMRMRVSLLGGQAQIASRLRADLGRQWADELFTLSFQLQANDRSYAQDTATSILAGLDPDRALELLHSMIREEPDDKQIVSLPHMQLASKVFEVLVARDGVAALPKLEQEAERLGIQWHYPYAALAQVAMQTVSKEWGTNRQHAVEVVQSVFDKEFANYSRDPRRGYFDDLDFGNMLQVVAGGLPPETVQPALRTLVKNFLGTDLKKHHFRGEVYTRDGQIASADNAIDAAILNLGRLINRVDPELAQELEAARPELRVALPYAKDGVERSGMFGPRSENPRLADPNAEKRMDAVRLAHINSEAAIAKAEELPYGPQRTETILELARSIAGDDPERAAGLIAEAQSADTPSDKETTVDSISARAYLAAAQQRKDELQGLLGRGFDLAGLTILERPKLNFILGLGQLVQIGIQNEPDATASFLQNLPASPIKANLLMGAVSALNLHRQLPLRSRPKEKPQTSAEQNK